MSRPQSPAAARLDRIDHKILAELERDAALPNRDLASRVGLSPSACLRRVQRLKASGVIRRVVAVVDPAVSGAALSAMIEVMIVREQPDLLERCYRLFRSEPEITDAYLVSGETDFVLLARFDGMPGYEAFAQRVLIENPDVREFQSHFVVREIKARHGG
jgi:Lrp/AsnC family leucine-responsive transcriptional regulator